ncbi:MAG: hypothetical protein GY714_23625 [Desulfobacterales bacterium]|nr:hypothetical protein [Desulfobacterales bacterium]
MNQHHVIKKQIMDIALNSEVGSFGLQGQISNICHDIIAKIVDRYFSSAGDPDHIYRIDKLEIDLGEIRKENLEKDFSQKMEDIFPRVLSRKLNGLRKFSRDEDDVFASEGVWRSSSGDSSVDRKEHGCELLEFFIETGRLPWWVEKSRVSDLSGFMRTQIKENPAGMKGVFKKVLPDETKRRRIAGQFNDLALNEIVGLIRKEYQNMSMISDILEYLSDFLPLRTISSEKIRSELWVVMLGLCASSVAIFKQYEMIQEIAGHMAECFEVDGEEITAFLFKNLRDKGYSLDKEYDVERKKSKSAHRSTISDDADVHNLSSEDRPEKYDENNQLESKQKDLNLENMLNRKPLRDKTDGGERFLAGKKTDRLLPKKLSGNNRNTGKNRFGNIDEKQNRDRMEIIVSLGKCSDDISLVSLLKIPANINNAIKDISSFHDSLKRALEKGYLSSPVYQKDAVDVLEGLIQSLEKLTKDMETKSDRETVFRAIRSADKLRGLIVETSLNKSNHYREKIPETSYVNPFSDADEVFVSNSGIVLFWPYLTKLFESTGVMKKSGFVDDEKRMRALFMLQYLADGSDNAPEYDLVLNKILCGMDADEPVDSFITLSEEEKRECDGLISAVIIHWTSGTSLKHLSPQGLRSMFLKRDGLIRVRDATLVLKVEEKSHDILLDKLPWSVSNIKLPWMKSPLFAEWRL